MSDAEPIRCQMPPKAVFLLESGLPKGIFYKVLHGGRVSAKSTSIANALLIQGYEKKHRILCVREFQSSIRESVHQLLRDQIVALGLEWFYEVTRDEIVGQNGTQFIFAGLRKSIDSLKSMPGITRAWVEEAATVSQSSWDKLDPTVRRNQNGAANVEPSEIWVSFNPENQDDPTSKRFLGEKRDDAKVIEMNYSDNPWFNEGSRKEMQHAYRTDPDTAAHVWGGKFIKNSKAQIFADKYIVEEFTPQRNWHGPFFGSDFGFSQDPSTLVKLWLAPNLDKLYIEEEAWGINVELNDLAALYADVSGAKQNVIRCDCSRPETISHLRGFGLNTIPASKWPGSVEDGIMWLRSMDKIVIHPRCVHAQEEARKYSFKVNAVGDVTNVVKPGFDHIWDAVRYAMEPLIQAGDSEVVVNLGDDDVSALDQFESELPEGF